MKLTAWKMTSLDLSKERSTSDELRDFSKIFGNI